MRKMRERGGTHISFSWMCQLRQKNQEQKLSSGAKEISQEQCMREMRERGGTHSSFSWMCQDKKTKSKNCQVEQRKFKIKTYHPYFPPPRRDVDTGTVRGGARAYMPKGPGVWGGPKNFHFNSTLFIDEAGMKYVQHRQIDERIYLRCALRQACNGTALIVEGSLVQGNPLAQHRRLPSQRRD